MEVDRKKWADSDSLKQQANSFFNEGKYQLAIDAYSKGIDLLGTLCPTLYLWYSNRSACYEKLGDFSLALQDAQNCIDLNSCWPKGYYRKGKALLALNMIDDAIAAFKYGLSLDPANKEMKQGLQESRKKKELNISSHLIGRKIQWELLEDTSRKESKKECETFCEQIHSQGFCILSLPDNYGWGNKVKDMFKDAGSFFKLPLERKKKHVCWPDHGYSKPSESYEIFDVYTCYDTNFVWPAEVPTMEENTSVVTRACKEIAQTCLKMLAEGLEVDPVLFTNYLDSDDVTTQNFSCSALRILGYNKLASNQSEFADHCDFGLITVSPLSTLPALQLKSYMEDEGRSISQPWINIEDHMNDNDVIIFVGDTLARMTNNFYPAVLHRASLDRMKTYSTSKEHILRLSAPFFLRARVDSVIDIKKFNSPKIKDVAPEIQKPLQVLEIAENTTYVRDSWPWKRTTYHSSAQYTYM